MWHITSNVHTHIESCPPSYTLDKCKNILDRKLAASVRSATTSAGLMKHLYVSGIASMEAAEESLPMNFIINLFKM